MKYKSALSVMLICCLLSSCALLPQKAASSISGSHGAESSLPQVTSNSSQAVKSTPGSQPLENKANNDTGLYEDDNQDLIATSQAGIGKLYIDNKLSETGFKFFYNLLGGYQVGYQVSISDFKLRYNEKDYNENKKMEVDFTVDSSMLETLPVGKYQKDFYDIRYETLLDRGADLYAAEINKFADMDCVKRTKTWLMSTYAYNTPQYADENIDYDTCVNFICNFYGGVIKFEDFVKYAEKDFGIKPYRPEKWGELFYTDENGVDMVQAGGMGGAVAYDVLNAAEGPEGCVVTLQYYADYAKIMPSHKMEYKYGKNGEFLGSKIVSGGAYEPVGCYEGWFKKLGRYNNNPKTLDEFKNLAPTLAALATCDLDTLAKHDSARFTPEMIPYADTFKAISIRDIYCDEYGESAVATIEISESSNPCYQVGTAMYTLNGGISTGINRFNFSSNYDKLPVEIAMEHFISAQGAAQQKMPISVIDDGSMLGEYIINRLSIRNKTAEGFSSEEISAFAQKYLGLKDFKPQNLFENVPGSGLYSITPRGSNIYSYKFESIAGSREYPEITVQFYADDTKFVRSHKIKYTLQLLDGDYKFNDITVLEKGRFEPSCWGV